MRELAARDAAIEFQMLAGYVRRAEEVQHALYDADRDKEAYPIILLVSEARKTMGRMSTFASSFEYDLQADHANPSDAASFEKLADFELHGRQCLIIARDEAKAHLVPLGIATLEGRQSLGLI